MSMDKRWMASFPTVNIKERLKDDLVYGKTYNGQCDVTQNKT